MCDVALDPFNSDGHDGVVKDGVIQNDETFKFCVNNLNSGSSERI